MPAAPRAASAWRSDARLASATRAGVRPGAPASAASSTRPTSNACLPRPSRSRSAHFALHHVCSGPQLRSVAAEEARARSYPQALHQLCPAPVDDSPEGRWLGCVVPSGMRAGRSRAACSSGRSAAPSAAMPRRCPRHVAGAPAGAVCQQRIRLGRVGGAGRRGARRTGPAAGARCRLSHCRRRTSDDRRPEPAAAAGTDRPRAGYRLLLKPWLGNACRFEPTCSAYASRRCSATAPCAGGARRLAPAALPALVRRRLRPGARAVSKSCRRAVFPAEPAGRPPTALSP